MDSQDVVDSQNEVKSQDEVQDKISADEDVLIEENVGKTAFEMSASAADSSGRDNNEELGQASSADENVVDEQESKEDTSEGTWNEEEDSFAVDDGLSEGATELEESSGGTAGSE